MWELIGYPGPRKDPPPSAPLAPLTPVPVDGDTDLTCDVVVVGSGAGGAVAAAVLAQAGLDVIVVEAGGYHAEDAYDGVERQGGSRRCTSTAAPSPPTTRASRCWRARRSAAAPSSTTRRPSAPPTTCARSGRRTAWRRSPAPTTTGALDAVCERVGVNQEHNRPSERDAVMQKGLTELGWHSDFMPRNVRDCKQDERCGYCGYGCPYGAKQNALVTWLQDHASRAAA